MINCIKNKKIKISFIVFFVILLIIPSGNLQAASKNKKAKIAYGNFLKNHKDKYQWFRILNIGSKKEPILLVAENVGESREICYGRLYYYTGSKVKAVKGGEVWSSGTGYPFQYMNHSLFVGTRWGLGSMIKIKKGYTYGTSVYLNFSNGGTKENYYRASLKKGKLYNKKRISKKTYNSYEKKWNPYNSKQNRIIYMKRNTLSNRRIYTGVNK